MECLNFTVGIVGAGSMGGAIARGLVASGASSAASVFVCDLDQDKRASFMVQGHTVYARADELCGVGTDVVILAVKPQVLPALLFEIKDRLKGRLVISIAAGVSLRTLEAGLPDSRVVRVMPNLPIQVRSGATAICAGSRASDADVACARALFSTLGVAEVMREDQLDAEGATISCGPAFFALMIDALTRAGVRAGLPARDCRQMLAATMRGVAEQLLTSGEHPRVYMEKVTSPAGTTAEGLKALEPLLVEGAYEAVDAALRRTSELAGG